ncbi:Grainyhead-like protein 1-like, partial [Acipenser ruthenus]
LLISSCIFPSLRSMMVLQNDCQRYSYNANEIDAWKSYTENPLPAAAKARMKLSSEDDGVAALSFLYDHYKILDHNKRNQPLSASKQDPHHDDFMGPTSEVYDKNILSSIFDSIILPPQQKWTAESTFKETEIEGNNITERFHYSGFKWDQFVSREKSLMLGKHGCVTLAPNVMLQLKDFYFTQYVSLEQVLLHLPWFQSDSQSRKAKKLAD